MSWSSIDTSPSWTVKYSSMSVLIMNLSRTYSLVSSLPSRKRAITSLNCWLR